MQFPGARSRVILEEGRRRPDGGQLVGDRLAATEDLAAGHPSGWCTRGSANVAFDCTRP